MPWHSHWSRRPQRSWQVNLTSMVDIVFLLIIFFMLVSTFISAENVRMELPRPDHSRARALELPARVVINCRRAAGGGGRVRVLLGPIAVHSFQELELRLSAARRDQPDVQVVVRADRRIPYGAIRDIMKLIARAGVRHMHIAAEMED